VSLTYLALDGLVAGVSPRSTVAYFARNQGTPWESLRRVGELIMRSPRLDLLERWAPRSLPEHWARLFAGMSRDRLEVLSEELVERCREARGLVALRQLVERHADEGRSTLLVTVGLDCVARRLATEVGAVGTLANRLRFEGQVCIGQLEAPSLSVDTLSSAVRRDALSRGSALSDCGAVVGSIAGRALLEVVGHPLVVKGEPALEALALARQWPSVRLGVAA